MKIDLPFRAVLALAAGALLLTACGNKGALTLPPPPANANAQSADHNSPPPASAPR